MGDIAPGTRLREIEVAKSLAVSRTPVREAISRLIGDRLVRELPYGGVEVGETAAELYEIYHIREALESCAARMAAVSITESQLEKLEQLVAAAAALDENQFEARSRLNEEFHMTIIDAAGSIRLREMILGFREFFMNAKWLSRYDRKGLQHALQDHRDIIAALRRRSPATVEKLIRAHLKSAYAKLLSTRQPRPALPRRGRTRSAARANPT
jgi:DNA-binding GntR family transcriptional regulator